MRTAGSFVCWVIAVALALVAVPSSWAARSLTSSEGFAQMLAGIADEPQVQQEVAGAVVTGIGQNNPLLGRLSEPILTATFSKAAASQAFTDAWQESLRRSHDRLLDGDDNSNADVGVQVDVQPLAKFAVTSLGVTNSQLPAHMWVAAGDTQPDPRAIATVKAMPVIAWGSAIGALLAAAGTILLARRRSTAVAMVGLGGLIAGGLWLLIAGPGLSAAVDHYVTTGSSATARLVASHIASDLVSTSTWFTIAAAVVLVAGFGARLMAGRR